MFWQLSVASENHCGQEIPIARPVTWVGRGDSCHIRPTSLAISRRHCVLLCRHGKLYVSACPTTNGTFVNGCRIEGESELHDGDRLQLGPLTFVVEERSTPAEAAASTTTVEEDPVGAMLFDFDSLDAEDTVVPART